MLHFQPWSSNKSIFSFCIQLLAKDSKETQRESPSDVIMKGSGEITERHAKLTRLPIIFMRMRPSFRSRSCIDRCQRTAKKTTPADFDY